jgi:epoxide hydrolase
VDLDYLAELVEYWRTEYDWRAQEEELNRVPQFRVQVNGIGLHYLHVHSTNRSALPLMMVHGWPGSIMECMGVIPLLQDHFHIVCPALPGFGFSDAPRQPGFDAVATADTFVALMDLLGYGDRYVLQVGERGGSYYFVDVLLFFLSSSRVRC